MREHSTTVGTGKLISATALMRMRRAEDELVTHMKKMIVLLKVTAFGSVVVRADLKSARRLWVTVPHEQKALLVRPPDTHPNTVSKRTILAFFTRHTENKFATEMEQSTS